MSDRPTAEQLKARIGAITDPDELENLRAELDEQGEDRTTVWAALDDRTEALEAEAQEGPPEPRYTAAELISGARGLGASPAAMAGALAHAGLTEATRDEAKAALKAYGTEEVR